MRTLAAAALALSAGLAVAGDAGPTEVDGAPIPVSEWREMTAGRTVWYSLNGAHWGKEYFHPDRDSATFVAASGECMTAPWVYAEGIYCFGYVGLHCFRHLRRGATIVVAPVGGGAEQVVERIDTTPVSCEPPLSS